jgi:hypothetical protein
MATKNMFEELLEHIVNGEEAKAEEIFHTIVVNKSREIYENLIESDLEEVDIEEASEEEEMDEATEDDEEEMDESTEEEMDEAADEEDMDENFGFGEEEGGDETDDMMGDVESPAHDADDSDMDDMGDEGSVEDRVDNLEDKIDDLRAEFERLMADEKHEPEHHDGVDDPDFGDEDDEEDADESMMPAFEEEVEEIDLSPAEMMREYVDKIGEPYKGGKVAGTSETNVNTKSIVAKKNDMGGTTANIAKGGEGETRGTKGGLLDPSTKLQDGGNVNKPGNSAAATKLSAVSKGHGAEKKGPSETGGTNTKSLFK